MVPSKKFDSQEDNKTTAISWAAPPGKDMSAVLVKFIESKINELPEDIEQIEEVGYIVSIYWHEKRLGDESKIVDFLKQCVEIPLHNPIDDDEFAEE